MGPETGLKIPGVGVGNFAGGRVRRNECDQCGLCIALSLRYLQPANSFSGSCPGTEAWTPMRREIFDTAIKAWLKNPRPPTPKPPAQLIMVISVFFLCRQRGLLTNIGVQ